MLSISEDALRDGCDRAHDLFLLNRLQGPGRAGETLAAVFDALGITGEMRQHLERAVAELVPVTGMPVLERTATASMLSGVLVGLLIADSALPTDEIDIPVVSA